MAPLTEDGLELRHHGREIEIELPRKKEREPEAVVVVTPDKVREIIKMMDITGVPQVPSHVKGVINLGGKVIPIVDLRLKFNLPTQAYTERTCIIVVDVRAGEDHTMLGIVVDAVSEVLNIAAGDVDDPPAFGDAIDISPDPEPSLSVPRATGERRHFALGLSAEAVFSSNSGQT